MNDGNLINLSFVAHLVIHHPYSHAQFSDVAWKKHNSTYKLMEQRQQKS